MNADKVLQKFETTYATWRGKLEALDEKTFARKPSGGGWSVGEVCRHVRDVSEMLLGNAEKCAQGDAEDRGFSLLPAFLSFIGSFPPAKIKVPDDVPEDVRHLAHPQPMAKADALTGLEGVAARMRELRPVMDAASKRMRRPHPAGGYPHARQWYQMNEMHLRHHLRQLGRLTG